MKRLERLAWLAIRTNRVLPEVENLPISGIDLALNCLARVAGLLSGGQSGDGVKNEDQE